MNLEQAIKNEVEKINKFDWEQIFGKNSGAKKAVETLFATSLHSIALATAEALRVRVVMEPTHGNERIEAYQNGYKLAVYDSRQRGKEWFGIKAETPLVDNKEA